MTFDLVILYVGSYPIEILKYRYISEIHTNITSVLFQIEKTRITKKRQLKYEILCKQQK